MNINVEKLGKLIEELSIDVQGGHCESSEFIGEFPGQVIRISVIAVDDHGLDCLPERFRCIE